ncbi:MAG: hypothetical protein AAF797_13800 [Planctomycetota bacterium]
MPGERGQSEIGFSHELAYPLVSMTATERVEWLCMMLNLRLAAGTERHGGLVDGTGNAEAAASQAEPGAKG